VSESRTSPEISVKNKQEPPVVVPESLSPLAILAQCPDCVSANSVGPWGYGLTPAKLPQSLQSHAPNFEEPPPSTTSSISSCDQAVKPVESQQPSVVDREQSTSPYSDLVQTISRPSAEVHSPPLDLSPSLDIFREVWPKVNREMKHLSEARRSEVDLPSSVADPDRAIETDLGKLVESTNSLVGGMPPIESVQSLLETLSRCIPPFPDFEVPPMIEPLVFADSDLAAPLRGFRTLSPVASEAPDASSATSSALPDSVMNEQAAATPSPEQQQARITSLSCAFVSDTTVPDGQIFPPGAEFVKSWRMSNDGEEPWPETTEVHFVAGESFSPEADSSMVVKVGRVDPGEALDVWTGDLKAPDAPGRYVGYWKMTDGAGQSFGANIWIDVTVTEPRQSADEADDHSLASSSMVMPKSSSDNRSAHSVGPLGHLFEPSYPSTSKPATDVTDDGASDGSSVSLVSVPSSDDYASDWQDTRSQPENLEYVVLYDSNGSEDE
jgi:next-to-BRCA1 protein 1